MFKIGLLLTLLMNNCTVTEVIIIVGENRICLTIYGAIKYLDFFHNFIIVLTNLLKFEPMVDIETL